MWMIDSLYIPQYVATSDCSYRTRKICSHEFPTICSHSWLLKSYAKNYVVMNFPAIRSHIREFSFCPAYHSWLLNFRSSSIVSKSRQELLIRNGPLKPWAITPAKSRPADRSGSRSEETIIFLEARLADGSGDKLEETTIFLEVGLFIQVQYHNVWVKWKKR